MKFILPIIICSIGILGLTIGVLAKITSHPMGNDLLKYSPIILLVGILSIVIKAILLTEEDTSDH